MVKCDACLLANDVRYVRPPGTCEQCGIVTPYQDRLCSSCSDSAGRCQSCRSKRVTALISVPAATVPVLAALAQHSPPTHAQTLAQQRRLASPSDGYAAQHDQRVARAAATAPSSARPNVDRPLTSHSDMHTSRPATGRSSYVATSPFHWANRTTYSLDDPPQQQPQQQPATEQQPDSVDPSAKLGALVLHDSENAEQSEEPDAQSQYLTPLDPNASSTAMVPAAAAPAAAVPSHGSVILSPSGKLLPATLDPLSPRMAVRQNALGNAPQVRGETDAIDVVAGWTKPELINTLFHYYCNWQATKLNTTLTLSRFRSFAIDAKISSGRESTASAGSPALSSNRLDILFTQCTRPLSGSRSRMTEDQFFEALGALALWKYGGGSTVLGGKLTATQKNPSRLVPALEKLFETNLIPLARNIVRARSGGIGLRSEEFDPVVTSMLLKYEDPLKKIFVRLSRDHYADFARVDEKVSHPLLEEGWRQFCKHYGFFPENISITTCLRLFVGTATGLLRSGNRELPAMSFDDFMHVLFQLAQVSFPLTPHAMPIERVELMLHKIDDKAREIGFMPIAHRSGMGAQRISNTARDAQGALVVQGVKSTEDLRETYVASLASANADEAFAGVHGLFVADHMSAARDLFNLYCNTASQASYTEILPRLAWVKMLRDSGLLDTLLTPADGDILFNATLASCHQSQNVGSHAFKHGRHFTFNVFLLALLEVAQKAYTGQAISAALRELFSNFLEPLLSRKIDQLQQTQNNVELPLGAGLNSAGVSGGAAGPGDWGAKWSTSRNASQSGAGGDGGDEKQQNDASSTLGSTSSTLYPNHPSAGENIDASSLLAHDEGIRGLFSTYHKVLSKAFYSASYDGIEAQNGVSIPRLNSVLSTSASSQTTQNWDQFLQSKQLLSEHSFRRWVSLHKLVPELLAHKQITMLFRQANVGFDRNQDEFVLNWTEFKEMLLRMALLAFCGTAYSSYTTPASKLELLFFVLDTNSSGGFAFKGFSHLPQQFAPLAGAGLALGQSAAEAGVLHRSGNMGKAYWERTHSSELGVKALLEAAESNDSGRRGKRSIMAGSDEEDDEGDAAASSSEQRTLRMPPTHFGHGARSHTAVVTHPTSATVLPLRNFNTSLSTPRAPYATPLLAPMDPAREPVQQQNPPSMSPTRHLFAQTPFAPPEKRAATKFAANTYAKQRP